MWNLVYLKSGKTFLTPKTGTSAQQLRVIQSIIKANYPYGKLVCIRTVFSI